MPLDDLPKLVQRPQGGYRIFILSIGYETNYL